MKFSVVKILLLSLIIISCNHGIGPEETTTIQPGFSGTISFKGNWQSDIVMTNIVLFKNPLNTSADFNALNLSYVSEIIPNGSTEYSFNTNSGNAIIQNIQPGNYSYLAVAQSKTTLSLNRADWVIVGLYYTGNDSTNPGELIVPENQLLSNVNISCDFNNPPIQPPGE